MIFPNKTSHVAAVTPFSGYWKWIHARICNWSVAEEAEYVMSHPSAGIIFFFLFSHCALLCAYNFKEESIKNKGNMLALQL